MTLQEAISENKKFPVKMAYSSKIYNVGQLFTQDTFSAGEVLSKWEIAPIHKLEWKCTKEKRKGVVYPDDPSVLDTLKLFDGQKIKVTVEILNE